MSDDTGRFDRTCPVCGLRWMASGNRAKFCSTACRMWSAKNPGVRRPKTNSCVTCGLPTVNRKGRYCSSACRPVTRPRGRPKTTPLSLRRRTAPCDFCTAEFTTSNSLQRFCSEWCSDRGSLRPGTYEARTGRSCPYCGDEIPITARINQRFCSTNCQNKQNQEMRRARRRGAPAEQTDRIAIFERDGWVCHLCLEPIDPALRNRTPMSASLDHVIPLARPDSPGHVPSNVAASHLRCNMSKGAGTLVGRPEHGRRTRGIAR